MIDDDMVPDIDMITDDALPDAAGVELRAAEPDPNSLGAILSEAVADVEAAGGREAHLLRGVIGKAAFDSLPARKSTAQAWQAWRDASPQTKPQATRLLAIALARAADKPHLVERIVREISDMDPFARDASQPPLKAPVKAQDHAGARAEKVLPRAATKVAPKDRYIAMLKLAEKPDASSYIRARSAER
jgi:hypothetical protein